MNTGLECYPCLVKHSCSLLRDMEVEESVRVRLMQEILGIMSSTDYRLSPPEMTALFYNRLAELMHDPQLDPYREKKDRSTRLAWELLKQMEESGELDLDSFESRVRMAIAGNVLDFSIYTNLSWEDARGTVQAAMTAPIDREALGKLEARMEAARSIVYVLDNCGEAVFDRLLMEPYKDKITVGVRGWPATNDVTRREVAASGLGEYRIVDSGLRMPGLVEELSSQEMKDTLRGADLVIAKGQGNFECLNDSDLPLAFLFMAKCPVVVRLLGVQPRSLQVRFGKTLS